MRTGIRAKAPRRKGVKANTSVLGVVQGPNHGVFRTIRYADWRFTGHGCKHTKVQCEPWVTNGYVGFRVVRGGE